MNLRPLSMTLPFVAVIMWLVAPTANAQTQEPFGTATPETGVVLTKPSPPVYPPLARQAVIFLET
jgi:hypothetical protein